MANNYEQCTIEPSIPGRLVTPLELILLEGFGFTRYPAKPDPDGTLYFYTEESTIEEFGGDLSLEFLKNDPSPIAKDILEWCAKEGKTEIGGMDSVPSEVVSWPDVFQAILNKPENSGEERITEIVAMAAYTCSKPRAGEFGGWCCRITSETIQHDGTYVAIERMREFDSLSEDITMVCQLAEGALDANKMGVSTAEIVHRQRLAIEKVRKILTIYN